MRVPAGRIAAPPFPPGMEWCNGEPLRMERLGGRVVLVEFWDFCRPNSIRTLPYLREWNRRYAEHGLTVIGVHSPGFEPSYDPAAVRDAAARLGVEHAVAIDSEHLVWNDYENAGWPARYLWDQRGGLFEYHYGEGAYAETELAICELLGIADIEPMAPMRPEDAPEAVLVPQTMDQPGDYSGPYEAGGVWAVLSLASGPQRAAGPQGASATGGESAAGAGEVVVNGRSVAVDHPGAYMLIEHERHTMGVLSLEVCDGVVCHATCFTPGVAPD